MTDSKDFQLSQPGTFSDPLTEVLRNGARALLSQAVEAEVAALLSRYADKLTDDGRQRLVRHGHLPEREITVTGLGPVTVRCPRVRDRVGEGSERIRFSSAILPTHARRSKSLEALIPILYLKGVSTGDFEEALLALLGKDAGGLSASTIGRLKDAWSDEHAHWSKRDLSAKRYVYFWVDGIQVQARLEDDARCLLVIIGATPEGKKEIVGLIDGVRESAQSWRELLLDLKRRGLAIGPELAIADGALGFWQAVEEVWPKTRGQRADAIALETGWRIARLLFLFRKSNNMNRRLFEGLIGHPVTLGAVVIAAISTAMLSVDAAHIFIDALYRTYIDICINILVLYVPVYFLVFGAMSYLIARYGLFCRNDESPQQTLTEMLPRIYGSQRPRLVILVPSYREEGKVIRQTLVSAALVEYPEKRVVLLIDDPPFPANTEDQQKLAAARRTIDEMRELFRTPCEIMKSQLKLFLEGRTQKYTEPVLECRRLAHLYEESARWLEEQAVRFSNAWGAQQLEPADQFFIDKVLIGLARTHRQRASEVLQSFLSLDQISLEYRRLASLYDTAFSSFERKRYTNLSHAPNKAMNLNSYISLLGETVREVERADGLHIERVGQEDGTIDIPQADYIINLDADTLLLSDYVIRLVDVMEQPGNERLAVAQAPYSAFPNPTSMVERIAGATTDVQYLTHQGMTFFNATSWVGANALIRRAALEDIATSTVERGHRLKVYIQDTTLIEDTAASIDLIHHKWHLYNYQARLAFSATPRDFGTLIIQRRRWANGGILIFPSLLRYSFQRPFSLTGLAESVVRSNYLLGPALTSVGMLVLLVCSFDDYLFSLWVPLVAIPYQIVYCLDLRLAGHRLSDVPRVYALNMMLIPVYLGGTMQSILQAFTRRKAAFCRTPKVAGRTSTQLLYLAFLYGLLAWCGLVFFGDLLAGRTYHMIFTSINSAAYLYGVVRFIGIRESWQDVAANLRSRISNARERRSALSSRAANAKGIRA